MLVRRLCSMNEADMLCYTVISQFLPALEAEGFLGLAFLIVGQEKHTLAAGRARLAESVSDYLDGYGYPYRIYAGVVAVDPLQHT
jgi:hypothetical protein